MPHRPKPLQSDVSAGGLAAGLFLDSLESPNGTPTADAPTPNTLRRMLRLHLPSPLSDDRPTHLSPTAYGAGLRGLAASPRAAAPPSFSRSASRSAHHQAHVNVNKWSPTYMLERLNPKASASRSATPPKAVPPAKQPALAAAAAAAGIAAAASSAGGQRRLAANSRWRGLGAGGAASTAANAFVAELQKKPGHSLVEDAKRRHAALNMSLLRLAAGSSPNSPRLAVEASTESLPTPRTCTALASTFSGTYGNLLRDHDRSAARLITELAKVNPAAFEEHAASQAEADHRAAADRAKAVLRELRPGSASGASKQYRHCVTNVLTTRPFFVLPHQKGYQACSRVQVEAEVVGEKPKKVWQLETSLFVQRKKECDSRDFWTTQKVKTGQFNLDWERVVAKTRFRKLVAREDRGVRGAGGSDQGAGGQLQRELEEIRAELFNRMDIIRSTFNYYSMTGGNATSASILSMTSNQWTLFAQEAGLVDNSKRGRTGADLDTMFVACNYEEGGQGTEEGDANDDGALMRFEYLEILVRAAFGRHITTGELTDSSDSVARLLDECLLANEGLPPEARLDPDAFRRHRFYTEQMEEALLRHWELLAVVHRLYRAKDRTRFFAIEHWVALLEGTGLLGTHTGVERREAKLIFAWSQMLVMDELKRRKRAIALTFWDFIEAMARLADLLSPPTREQLNEFFMEDGSGAGPATSNAHIWEYYSKIKAGDLQLTRRESAELAAVPTRPLHEKFEGLMEVLTRGLLECWGGKNPADLLAKMTKMATMLSGGIELG